MGLSDFLQQVNDEVKIINSSDFNIEVIETKTVPTREDKEITYENIDTKTKKCKSIETCVLYIDIRKSTELSLTHYPKTLSKLYSSFVKSMLRASRYHGGHVRNIIGDRVMVVFDSENCMTNAVNTAILLNTVSSGIMNKHFKNNEVKCGIGIDYGKMLVTKVGTVNHGIENIEYKSLVWLGKPANIASKLTDIANKTHKGRNEFINEGLHYPLTDAWSWSKLSYGEFIDNLEANFTVNLKYKNPYFNAFIKHSDDITTNAILITEVVYNEFKKKNPNDATIKNNWWIKEDIKIPEYDGVIYGGSIIYKNALDKVR
ncbi:adenylate/guanylate cyclase domain-containing protein [Clostridium sp. CS001]|uniref:adenylate/guanylate cyclase domain-containing protein n=1 Tax=Clostridium sp. CS001 TaxID=2880648 RepID=UPI001CF5306E|nr:adenylate/guanylate cyclase domain-containing protein [Clostridium sp. CS001]MCB2290821.1 adenylate/guanylate cyclase domain-containing protein [Clostridium sp. CS001]